MNLPSYLVRNKDNGRFYFRLVVPKHLRPLVGRSVIKRSLHTYDPRQAQAWACVLSCRYAQLFNLLAHGKSVADKTLDELLASAQKGRNQDYIIKQSPSGSLTLQADGDEDHKRLLEALAALPPPREHSPRAGAYPAPIGLPMGVSAIAIGKARDKWLEFIKPNTKPKTFSSSKKPAIDGFVEWMKPKTSVYTITRTELANYSQELLKSGLSKTTANNKLSYIKGFFDWCQNSGYYPKTDNPAQGHVVLTRRDKNASASRGWQSFSSEQLKEIFDPDNFFTVLKGDEIRWIALIALYTGARSNEIAHLELIDIYKLGNTPILDINLLGEHKSLKTEASKRQIPIHPDLIALGLLERVERLQRLDETKLFPRLNFNALNGPASATQKSFNRYLEKLSIKPRGVGKVGLHSFRDTVINEMRNAGVSQSWREMYVGHEASEAINTQTSSHTIAYTEKHAVEQVAKHCHPALNWESKGVLDTSKLRTLLT